MILRMHLPRTQRVILVMSLLFQLQISIGSNCLCARVLGQDTAYTFADAVYIENAFLKAGVSPATGRIVYFSRAGGSNLLWTNKADEIRQQKQSGPRTWVNYGGDKVWPAQQANWPQIQGRAWPPDPAIDGSAWTLTEYSSNRIVIRSPQLTRLGITLTRTVELLQDKPALSIFNRIERFAENPFPVQIWSITQIQLPEFCFLDLWKEQPFPEQPFLEWNNKGATSAMSELRMLRHSPFNDGREAKTGAFGSWLAAVNGKEVFVQCFSPDRRGCFPDRASLEVYSNRYYMELETLSDSKHLSAGQVLENQVCWMIIPRSGTPDQLRKIIEGE